MTSIEHSIYQISTHIITNQWYHVTFKKSIVDINISNILQYNADGDFCVPCIYNHSSKSMNGNIGCAMLEYAMTRFTCATQHKTKSSVLTLIPAEKNHSVHSILNN